MAHNRTHPEDGFPFDALVEVIQRRMEMEQAEAEATAEKLQGLFHGEMVIEDTEVESDERSFLWTLMLEGIVTVETQHRPHPDHGRTWRYFYWHLVPPERLAEREEPDTGEESIYDDLPTDLWRDHAAAA